MLNLNFFDIFFGTFVTIFFSIFYKFILKASHPLEYGKLIVKRLKHTHTACRHIYLMNWDMAINEIIPILMLAIMPHWRFNIVYHLWQIIIPFIRKIINYVSCIEQVPIKFSTTILDLQWFTGMSFSFIDSYLKGVRTCINISMLTYYILNDMWQLYN